MTNLSAVRFRCTNAVVLLLRLVALCLILLFWVLAIRRLPPPISTPTSSTELATRRNTGILSLLNAKAAYCVAAAIGTTTEFVESFILRRTTSLPTIALAKTILSRSASGECATSGCAMSYTCCHGGLCGMA